MTERIVRYDVVGSTMSLAREAANAGAPSGTAIVAAQQTGGRGRHGRSWFAPKGSGLYLTLVVKPEPRSDLHVLGLVAGVAVRRALAELGVAAVIKWPNDVLVADGRKLAGILLEAEQMDTAAPLVLVGIGVNVAARADVQPPGEIAERYVGACDMAVGTSVEAVLQAVLRAWDAALEGFFANGFAAVLPELQQYDALKNALVNADAGNGEITGHARGVNADGSLRVEVDGTMHAIRSGEVVRVRKAR